MDPILQSQLSFILPPHPQFPLPPLQALIKDTWLEVDGEEWRAWSCKESKSGWNIRNLPLTKITHPTRKDTNNINLAMKFCYHASTKYLGLLEKRGINLSKCYIISKSTYQFNRKRGSQSKM